MSKSVTPSFNTMIRICAWCGEEIKEDNFYLWKPTEEWLHNIHVGEFRNSRGLPISGVIGDLKQENIDK